MTTYLYFFGAGERVKIGISRDVDARLKQVGQHMADPPVLLGSIKTKRGLEKWLHEYLSPYRLSGEWFRNATEVRVTIDTILKFGAERLGFVEADPPKQQEMKGGRGPEAIPDLCRLMWSDDALAQLQALTGESEGTCRGWMADGNSIPPQTRLAIAALVIMWMQRE